MAGILVYQENPGYIYVGGQEVPLEDVVMNHMQHPISDATLISLRSSSSNKTWLSNMPLADIVDDEDNGYADLDAWLVWWNGLDKGLTASTETGVEDLIAVAEDILDDTANMDTNIGAIKTAVELLDNALDGNYLNVNQNIAGTDVAAGAGNSNAQTQRVTVATDDVNLAAMKIALELIDNAMDGNYINVNMNIAGTDVAAGAGNVNAQTQRVTIAGDDANQAAIKTALQLLDNAVDGNYLNVNVNMAGTDAATGAGVNGATVQRVAIATDDVNTALIKTAVQNIDTGQSDGSQKTQVVDASGNVADLSVIIMIKTETFDRPANTTSYDAGDSVNAVVSVKQKNTITLTGSGGTANVTAAGGLTKLATYNASLTQTAADFVSVHAAAYAAVGITVTSSGDDIIFESSVAGIPFTPPVITNVTTNLSGTVANTTANVTPDPILFAEVAKADGGGVIIEGVKIETEAVEFAGKQVRLWLFNADPTFYTGDGDGFLNLYANADKSNAVPYVDVTFNALVSGSDCVVGFSSPQSMFVCADAADDMYVCMQTIEAVTTPTSAAGFRITFNMTQI